MTGDGSGELTGARRRGGRGAEERRRQGRAIEISLVWREKDSREPRSPF